MSIIGLIPSNDAQNDLAAHYVFLLLLFLLQTIIFMQCMCLYPCTNYSNQKFVTTYTDSSASKQFVAVQWNIIFKNMLFGWVIYIRMIIVYVKKDGKNVYVDDTSVWITYNYRTTGCCVK